MTMRVVGSMSLNQMASDPRATNGSAKVEDEASTRTIHEFLTFLAHLQFEWIAPLESLNDRSPF